jgi:DNA polymerase III subunit delta'
MWKTFGHTSVKKILEKQVKTGLFHHAYLFQGPDGVGKKQVALELAQKIIGASNLSNHPDFEILETEGEITVEPVLELIGRLNFKPFIAKKKVTIIDSAQNLNAQSSNAFLKTLEEPARDTVIILISNSKNLLPTIISRCQVFNFNGFAEKEMLEFAKRENLEIKEPLLSLSFGRPGRLKILCRDKEELENLNSRIEDYEKIRQSPPAERLLKISEFSKLEAEDLGKTVVNWCFWQSFRLKQNPNSYESLRALVKAYKDIKKNKNKKIILQDLFLKI